MKRDGFNSKIGALLAMVGSAVGLGNLWRFPYMVGQYGGAAFILLYLFFVIALGYPILCAELALGKHTRQNTVGAFKQIRPKTKWYLVGILGVITAFLILGFYSVVGGWTIDYMFRSVLNEFHSLDSNGISSVFSGFIASPIRPLMFTLLFVFITFLVVLSGVQKGIEKWSKILIPVLFLLVIALAVRSMTLPGAAEGLRFMLLPDLSKITGSVALQAMGQAMFTLSVGMGCMITYGSYLPKDADIMRSGAKVIISDTCFALIACLAIMPAVFAFGVEPTQGAGLAFVIFPGLFQQFPGGYIFQIIFFAGLFVAALTSSISLLEVPTAYILEEFKISRKKAVSWVSAIVLVLAVMASLSMGKWSSVTIAGKGFFDMFDFVASNVLMPFTGLLIVVFVGWVWGKKAYYNELSNDGQFQIKKAFNATFFLTRFILPVGMLLVFMSLLGLF